jgi:hypothetical protein
MGFEEDAEAKCREGWMTAEYCLLFVSRLHKSFDTQHKSIEGVLKNPKIDV